METVLIILFLVAAFVADIYMGHKAIMTLSVGWLVAHVACTATSIILTVLSIVYLVDGSLV